MSTERLIIQGHMALEAVLRKGDREGGVVICHPHPQYGGSMSNNVVSAIDEGFSHAGMTTLKFNFRGVGRSSGRYSDGIGEIEDVLDACSFLRDRIGAEQPFVLAGYSFGAWAAGNVNSSLDGPFDLFFVAFPFSAYPAPDMGAFQGRVTLVGGFRDDICPIGDLLAFYQSLQCDKYFKAIPTSHFFEGRESEITDFILEIYAKNDRQ
jgi:uncharacterized protein